MIGEEKIGYQGGLRREGCHGKGQRNPITSNAIHSIQTTFFLNSPISAVNSDCVRVRYFWRPFPWRVFLLPLFHVATSESSYFQRFVGLFSSKDEPKIQFKTNDIEMTTFSVVSGQSPDVLMPALCCSAAGRTPNGRGWFVNCDPVTRQRFWLRSCS